MYTFKNMKTGQVYKCWSLAAACRKRIKVDNEYGACITTFPSYVECGKEPAGPVEKNSHY